MDQLAPLPNLPAYYRSLQEYSKFSMAERCAVKGCTKWAVSATSRYCELEAHKPKGAPGRRPAFKGHLMFAVSAVVKFGRGMLDG